MTTSHSSHCDCCDRAVPFSELREVLVMPQTHDSPAEYQGWCPACLEEAERTRKPRTRHERLQMAADAGYDTWSEYRGEK